MAFTEDVFNNNEIGAWWTESYQTSGSASESGTFLIVQSGENDVNHNPQELNPSGLYQEVAAGDFDIKLKLTDTDPDNIGNPKVGILVEIDSTHYIYLCRYNEISAIYGYYDGGSSGGGSRNITFGGHPQYFRARRSTNTITLYTSDNGTDWTSRVSRNFGSAPAVNLWIIANHDIYSQFTADFDWILNEGTSLSSSTSSSSESSSSSSESSSSSSYSSGVWYEVPDYGIQINNLYGNTIIDGTFKNYTYSQHGSNTLSAGINYIDIDPVTEKCVMAVKAPPSAGSFNNSVVTYGLQKSDGDYNRIMLTTSTTAGLDIDWILFVDQPPNPSGDYGLEIKNRGGDTVFSSNEHGYIEILGIWNFSTPPYLDLYNDATVINADDNYFIQVGGGVFESYESPDTTYKYMLGINKANKTLVNLIWTYIETVNGYVAYDPQGAILSPSFLIEIKTPQILSSSSSSVSSSSSSI